MDILDKFVVFITETLFPTQGWKRDTFAKEKQSEWGHNFIQFPVEKTSNLPGFIKDRGGFNDFQVVGYHKPPD